MTPEPGWWTCPNDPKCSHPGVVHDGDGGEERRVCCVEGCDCGREDER